MFSLVATLAFGSFAMANSVEVETVEAVSVENAIKLSSKKAESKKAFFSNHLSCQNEGNTARNAIIASGGSHQAANAAYYSAYFGCMATNAPNIIKR
jgi:hypothetical protein